MLHFANLDEAFAIVERKPKKENKYSSNTTPKKKEKTVKELKEVIKEPFENDKNTDSNTNHYSIQIKNKNVLAILQKIDPSFRTEFVESAVMAFFSPNRQNSSEISLLLLFCIFVVMIDIGVRVWKK